MDCIVHGVAKSRTRLSDFHSRYKLIPNSYLTKNSYNSKGFPWWLSSKESACSVGDLGSIPGLGRSPGEGHGNVSSVLA